MLVRSVTACVSFLPAGFFVRGEAFGFFLAELLAFRQVSPPSLTPTSTSEASTVTPSRMPGRASSELAWSLRPAFPWLLPSTACARQGRFDGGTPLGLHLIVSCFVLTIAITYQATMLRRLRLGCFDGRILFRCQPSITGLRSIHHVAKSVSHSSLPSDSPPATIKDPSWVMLNSHGGSSIGTGDDSSVADPNTIAESRTSTGLSLRVSFAPAPPASSFLYYDWTESSPDDEEEEDEEEEEEDEEDDEEEDDNRTTITTTRTCILRRGENDLRVVHIQVKYDRDARRDMAQFCVLCHGTSEWELNEPVNYTSGFYLCDMADVASPRVRQVPLPPDVSRDDDDYYDDNLDDDIFSVKFSKSMGAAGSNAVRSMIHGKRIIICWQSFSAADDRRQPPPPLLSGPSSPPPAATPTSSSPPGLLPLPPPHYFIAFAVVESQGEAAVLVAAAVEEGQGEAAAREATVVEEGPREEVAWSCGGEGGPSCRPVPPPLSPPSSPPPAATSTSSSPLGLLPPPPPHLFIAFAAMESQGEAAVLVAAAVEEGQGEAAAREAMAVEEGQGKVEVRGAVVLEGLVRWWDVELWWRRRGKVTAKIQTNSNIYARWFGPEQPINS
ncbi:hypothetical protein HU200_029118 [Digitaria exilis]|uniref:Uncharacterized protein n=1 Tax=Digitaria exilis TaxID=1010633 RepID=A0A835BT45_9POAL|nr:hypothetical protein HU200_029118 [Digitaria exilis]